jgi:hypothetical protein
MGRRRQVAAGTEVKITAACLPLENVVGNRRQVVHLRDGASRNLLREILELSLQPLCALHRHMHIDTMHHHAQQMAATLQQVCHRHCRRQLRVQRQIDRSGTCMLCHVGISSAGAEPFVSAAGFPRNLATRRKELNEHAARCWAFRRTAGTSVNRAVAQRAHGLGHLENMSPSKGPAPGAGGCAAAAMPVPAAALEVPCCPCGSFLLPPPPCFTSGRSAAAADAVVARACAGLPGAWDAALPSVRLAGSPGESSRVRSTT